MKIYLGADHRGFEQKNQLAEWLSDQGHTVVDLGPNELVADDDYPDYAFAVASAVVADSTSLGIGICGSGVGMAIAANKVRGMRAGQARDPELAAVGRSDDDTNFLALSSDYNDIKDNIEVVKAWLASGFSGEERHQRRVKKIQTYETKRNGSGSS